MKKLSVIIPTIQARPKVLNKLLTILYNDCVVDEIILINNLNKEFIPDVKLQKLKIYNQEKNLFVNPSWNLGIELIKNDYFSIMNDDILFPYNSCSKVVNSGILDKEDTGLVGLYYWKINSFSLDFEDIDIPDRNENLPFEFIPFDYYMGTGNWGSVFFGKKENYYKIPDGLKIIFGDNYLLKNNLDAGKKNYFIKNLECNHIASASSSQLNPKDFEFAKRYFGENNLIAVHFEPITQINITNIKITF